MRRAWRDHGPFRAKLGVALEECDECVYWLEFLRDAELVKVDEIIGLFSEGKELVRILTAPRLLQEMPNA